MRANVRLATTEDSPGIIACIKAVYDEYGFIWDPNDYHADLYDLQKYYFNADDLFWVAVSPESEIIGTIALCFHDSLPGIAGKTILINNVWRVAQTDAEVNRLYVHPEARRMGVASALMDALLKECERRGVQRLELWSDKKFTAAHTLYLRLGASIVGERLCHDPEQSPEWGLLLPVNEKMGAQLN